MTKKICIVEHEKLVAEGKEYTTLCGTTTKALFRKGDEIHERIENCPGCLTKHRLRKPNPIKHVFSAQVVITAM